MPAPGPPVAGTDAVATGFTAQPVAPAVVDAGDILLIVAVDHSPVSPGTSFDWNDTHAFTEGRRVEIKDSSGTVVGQAGWAWLRADGSEDGATVNVVRVGGDSGNDSCFMAHIFKIPGCIASGTPFDVDVVNNPNESTTGDFPAITTLTADSLLMSFILKGGRNSNYATPADWTVAGNASRTAGSDGAIDVDYRQVTSIDTYDPASPTLVTDADTGWAAFQIAFIPPAAGGTLVQGTASLSGGGSLSAQGQRTVKGVAALSSSDTLTVSGKRTVKGQASLSGGGSLTSAGKRIVYGSSVLDGGGVLVASGVVTGGGVLVQGTASLLGGGSLSSQGKRTVKGQASLSGGGQLSAAGKRTVLGSASLTSTTSLSSSGKRTVFGAVLLSGGGALSALGSVLVEVVTTDVRVTHYDSGQALAAFGSGVELAPFDSGVELVAFGRNVRQTQYDSSVEVVNF